MNKEQQPHKELKFTYSGKVEQFGRFLRLLQLSREWQQRESEERKEK